MAKNKINRVPDSLDLALYAGDGVSIRLGVTTSGGAPLDIAGEMKAQIRQTKSAAEVAAEFEAVPDAENSSVVISLTGEQTASLIANGESFRGVWDIQWHPTDGQPVTLIQGEVTCDADVTR
jgi:hypothetical protein